jgi:hypothetical protein
MEFTGHERDLADPASDQDGLDYVLAVHYSKELNEHSRGQVRLGYAITWLDRSTLRLTKIIAK